MASHILRLRNVKLLTEAKKREAAVSASGFSLGDSSYLRDFVENLTDIFHDQTRQPKPCDISLCQCPK